MIRKIASTTAGLAVLLCSSPSFAGIYTDDLGKCLVASTSADDKTTLVQWIFALMALNPAVKPFSTVSDEQREILDKKNMALSERLLEKDCRAQTVAALKYEGPSAFELSFQLLGQVAMRGLMSDPTVSKGMQALDKFVDKNNIAALYQEAGISPPPQSKPAP